jgi:hypothetical protein
MDARAVWSGAHPERGENRGRSRAAAAGPAAGMGGDMPEDSTRRLLRVFGIAMTDCEDALAGLTAALAGPSGTDAATAFEAYGKAAGEVARHWAELSRLILDYHARAEAALAGQLRRGGAG